MEKVLLNISNHPSERWSAEQREGWDKIIDIPFPEVPPDLDTSDEAYQKLVDEVVSKVRVLHDRHREALLIGTMLMGEFSLCYTVFETLRKESDGYLFYIPTTKRQVEEVILPDGHVEKKSIIKFVRWRVL